VSEVALAEYNNLVKAFHAVELISLSALQQPERKPRSDNYYTQDGCSGGSYVNCSDPGRR
jgi:hypothetical protein